MATYTRQSGFSNGDVIDATQLNAEFDQLAAAFVQATGHRHNAEGEGGYIPLVADQAGITSARVDVTDPNDHKIIFNIKGTDVFTYSETQGVISDNFATKVEELSNVNAPLASGYFRWNTAGDTVEYKATIPLGDVEAITETANGYWKWDATAENMVPVLTIPHTDITGLITANIDHRGTTLEAVLDDFDTRVTDAGADAAAAAASAAEAETSATRAENAAMAVGIPVYVADGGTFSIGTQEVVDVVFLGDGSVTFPENLTQGARYYIRLTRDTIAGKKVTLVNPNFSIYGSKTTVPAGTNLIVEAGQMVILEALSANELEII